MVKKFDPKLYFDLFEKWDDPVMQAHFRDEFKIISKVKNPDKKTFIDLGAGYGRVLSNISKIAMNVISIDIDEDMFKELNRRKRSYKSTTAIKGNIAELSKVLDKLEGVEIVNPVLLILQNTLGTIEEGNWRDVLREMRKVARDYKGEVILSLYRQKALKGWGLMTYYHGKEMNGEPDLEKTDFSKGQFVSKTGYTSKWWKDSEIEDMKRFFGGTILNEVVANEYWIIHLGY